MQTQTYVTEAPRRRRRWPIILVILLVVMVALAVTADRVAASVADDRIADEVDKELDRRGFQTESTDVSVGGFPFLTQVMAGKYDEITIDMTGVEGERGRLPQLTVIAHGVVADTQEVIDGTAQVTADEVTGTGLVDWATLAALAVDYADVPGLSDVAFSGSEGALRLRATATLLGRNYPLTALADLSVKNNVLHVQVRDAEVEGTKLIPVVQAALDDLERRLNADVDLPALPFELTVDEVTVRDDGLSVTATARGVPIVS